MAYEDKEIICRECGSAFVWTVGEQEFFAEKGLTNIPSRCPICRKKRDVRHDFKNLYDVICSKCGKKSKTPFAPPENGEALCHECFMEMQNKSEKESPEESGSSNTENEDQNQSAPPPAFEKPDGPPNQPKEML